MIPSNELRIGNYVMSDEGIVQITGILKTGFYHGEKSYVANISDWWKPIPLTEETLIMAGFEEKLSVWTKSRQAELGHNFGDFCVSIYDNTQIKLWRGDRYCGIMHCQFIHQLQNLYFALIGEELKINLL